MYHLMIKTHFSAAHNLLNYEGNCENLHGHNWKVEVTVATANLDEAGMGIDFKVLKGHTKEIMNDLDHKYLNDLEMFKGISPSSEYISKYIYDRLVTSLVDYDVEIEKVTVWESDNACATYTQD